MFDPSLGLLKIGTANIDDIAIVWIAQEFCAGEWTDERHFGLSRDRLCGRRCRRPDSPHEREYFFVVDQLFRWPDCLLRFIAVIQRVQLKLSAADPAGAIDLAESCENSLAHALAKRLC